MTSATGSSTVKRKTIDDFFPSKSSQDQKRNKTIPAERSPLSIPGLSIIHDFVIPKEEADVLRFLDSQQWRTDLSRRVTHYGGTYCLMPPRTATTEERKIIGSTIIKAQPVPPDLCFLINRMVDRELYNSSNVPTYCIVNEYKDNQGISAHVENFKFISPVCGLTLGDGGWIRFHELTAPDDGSVRSGRAAKAVRTGNKVDVWMPPRSLLVMSGDSRDRWQHEIVRNRKDRTTPWRRVSLTFRAEKKTTIWM